VRSPVAGYIQKKGESNTKTPKLKPDYYFCIINNKNRALAALLTAVCCVSVHVSFECKKCVYHN